MRIRFIGSGDPEEVACEVFGLSFPVAEWVDVEGPPAKLLANPLFEIEAPSRPRRVKRGDLP